MKSSYQFLAKEKMSTGKLDMSDCHQYNSVPKASSFSKKRIFYDLSKIRYLTCAINVIPADPFSLNATPHCTGTFLLRTKVIGYFREAAL